jgi:hypothetical protein
MQYYILSRLEPSTPGQCVGTVARAEPEEALGCKRIKESE